MEFRFLLTPACNFRCNFCHEEGLKSQYKPLKLNIDDIVYLYSIGKNNFNWDTLTLTGGEPTLYPNFDKLCRSLYEESAKITLQTNGSTMAENINTFHYIDQINISLQTMNSKMYKKITGTNFSHSNLVFNILKTRYVYPNKIIHLNVVMTKDKYNNFQDINDLLLFSKSVSAVIKFIEITTDNSEEYVDILNLEKYLISIGFRELCSNGLTRKLHKDQQIIILSRCDFGEAIISNSRVITRDIFIASDGTFRPYANEDFEIDIIHDIKNRSEKNILEKISHFWIK